MIKITKPGLFSSVQDIGRYGYQKYGVSVSGAMDSISHRLANLLVGNDEYQSTIECTMAGPEMEFHQDCLLSICGGDFNPTINKQSVGMWRPVWVKKGSVLRFGQSIEGCRAYLAVSGGFDVPKVLGSRSTFMRAKMGGFQGRALKKGDQLKTGRASAVAEQIQRLAGKKDGPIVSFHETNWFVRPPYSSRFKRKLPIRVVKSKQTEWFAKDTQNQLVERLFTITAQSDRMGYRLDGPEIKWKEKKEMISEAVSIGTIQVPAEGNPIVLLADRQTTGGYPKIAQVTTVDIPYLAQMKPGETLQFEWISLKEAQQLYLEREKEIQQLKTGLLLKIKGG
ncbi:antagonist of KipI [Salinibacillus kushneri]|uniref:Antagonist of KipI n=1 Tax=Salinibacillus kushneri TaxID=237682 RepID=A0A1I0CPA6_9BACI|nr:biotin-dependent carboxyltransferase family protein [Salinibacillus kushneri]SET21052.1 antagonist of KipI [Salinibacillus kushneri]